MRTLSRNINFSDTTPLTVEEMKEGEIRVTPDGVFARVGDQILFQSLWVDVTDNTYWQDSGQPATMLWSGTYWYPNSGTGAVGLEPIGTWADGYRPTGIRLNLEENDVMSTTIKDTEGNTIGFSAAYSRGTKLPLTFVGYDIGEIIFAGGSSTIRWIQIELEGALYTP